MITAIHTLSYHCLYGAQYVLIKQVTYGFVWSWVKKLKHFQSIIRFIIKTQGHILHVRKEFWNLYLRHNTQLYWGFVSAEQRLWSPPPSIAWMYRHVTFHCNNYHSLVVAPACSALTHSSLYVYNTIVIFILLSCCFVKWTLIWWSRCEIYFVCRRFTWTVVDDMNCPSLPDWLPGGIRRVKEKVVKVGDFPASYVRSWPKMLVSFRFAQCWWAKFVANSFAIL